MISNKRHLENGRVLFKYKPRKVSSIRDFPPNCGPSALQVDSKPDETGPTGVVILEGIGAESSRVAKNVLGDDVLNPKIASEIEIVAGFEIGAVNSPVNGEISGCLDILVEKIVMDANSLENLAEDVRPLENQLPGEAKFNKTHEVVAVSKPVMEERARSSDALVGQVTAMEMDDFPKDIDDLMTANELVELMRFDDKKSDLSKKDVDIKGEAVAKEPDDTGDLTLGRNPSEVLAKSTSDAYASAPKEILAGISVCVGPKESFRKRRVSAIRDFPPHCGLNAVLPTEEKDCSVERAPPQMAGAKAIGDEPELGTMSKKVMVDNVDDVREPIERDNVSQSPKRNDQESPGNEVHREVVHGLMAAPNCQHKKEIASKSNSDDATRGSAARKKNLSRKTKSKSVETRTTVAAADSSGGTCMDTAKFSDFREVDSNPTSPVFTHEKHDQQPLAITPLSVFRPVIDDSNDEEPNEKAIVVAPARKVYNRGTSGVKQRKKKLSLQQKGKFVAKKSKPASYDDDEGDNEGYTGDEVHHESSSANRTQDIDVTLPPFGSSSSGHNNDARNKVRETLRLFNTICRKLLQREESKSGRVDPSSSSKPKQAANRFDLMTAKIIKEKKKEVNTEKIIGKVPGVEVGDEFQYRVELALVGIHRPYQGGIDRMIYERVPVATSIVSSGAYEDDVEHAEELYYCGSGGQVVGKKKTPEDQKLERGNLALSNSIDKGTPVRVVRGWKETRLVDPQDPRPRTVTTYVYDGLYTVVERTTQEREGRKIFMFKLVRNPGQPELAWKELKRANRSKTRPGTCLADISGGKEQIPIAAVNTVDGDKPPDFAYVAKMMYPSWLEPRPPAGCGCSGRCTDSRKCRCAARNGGEIPYNHNGAIVESKPIVYECGPHCRCPPTCYNRVSQRGVRLQLEIFKTEKRGWGLRALTSVPSGSFICEYSGELLQDKEAEERIGNDEYLFDIGHNYQENTLNPEERASLAEEGGYTIDAAQFGNVGRFINHSCSPNVYAQYVIYDHDDKKMPHVMLFAMENIPPLQELTYHYNYSVDQIRDAEGNIKVKKCYCGSADCNGRLY